MLKIFSNIDKSELLHVVRRFEELEKQEKYRIDLSDTGAFLQIASLNLTENFKFNPHIHNKNDTLHKVSWSQECWIVLKGSVKVTYYDLNKAKLTEEILNFGDISISFNGGHAYETIANKSLIYEFKTGPYLGKDLDKTIIDL